MIASTHLTQRDSLHPSRQQRIPKQKRPKEAARPIKRTLFATKPGGRKPCSQCRAVGNKRNNGQDIPGAGYTEKSQVTDPITSAKPLIYSTLTCPKK